MISQELVKREVDINAVRQQATLGMNLINWIWALSFGIAIVFSLISLQRDLRAHALRLSGLFLLASIAFRSHNAWVYSASVFIIATAVTQLEFLQNLAAILRGAGREYFSYKKEAMSQEDVHVALRRRLAEDVLPPGDEKPLVASAQGSPTAQNELSGNEIEKRDRGHHGQIMWSPGDQGLVRVPANANILAKNQIIGDSVMKYLENRYCQPIERNVRITGRGGSLEVDGLMETTLTDFLFEIAYGPGDSAFHERIEQELIKLVSSYETLTKRNAVARRIVTCFSHEYSSISRLLLAPNSLAIHSKIATEIISYEELGISDQMRALSLDN